MICLTYPSGDIRHAILELQAHLGCSYQLTGLNLKLWEWMRLCR